MSALLRLWSWVRHPRQSNGGAAVIAESHARRAQLDQMTRTRQRDAAQTRQEQMRIRAAIRSGNPIEDAILGRQREERP